MTKLLKQSVRISLLAFAASALIGLVGCGAPAPTTEELWQAAMADAVFSQDDEVRELVNLTPEDERVIWDEAGQRVLLLSWHDYDDPCAPGAPLPEGCGGAPTLRPYLPEDCPALAHLFYETVHTACAADYTPAQLEAWAPGSGPDLAAWDASFQAHTTLVAEIGGRLAGFGDLDPVTGYLDLLYVSKDFQRRGVATALCNALEQASRARPFSTHASRTARPFFEKRGYRVLRSQQVERRGQQLENFVMEKP